MSATRPDYSVLPSIDRLLASAAASSLIADHGRAEVKQAAREHLAVCRREIAAGGRPTIEIDSLCDAIGAALAARERQRLRRVFNLSGTLLHTNLGRAPLPRSALNAVCEVASAECNLEYDLRSGQRGERDAHIEARLCRLTGAEAATMVNNNAAAVMLVLNTLAVRRRVLVSRGELVEIGASFRLPDIIASAGAELIEVGTTNRTHARDYQRAVDDGAALILKVHQSNFAIQGFTAAVDESSLATLCAEAGIPLVVDLGSGALIDLRDYGLPGEATPMEALAAGADIVTFSGDKLAGGPQAGMIVGRRELIDEINANPMKRALRCDKMTIAAMSALLDLYAHPQSLPAQLPALGRLLRDPRELQARAAPLVEILQEIFAGDAGVTLVDCDSQPGSGSLPNRVIPSAGIEIRPRASGRQSAWLERVARAFRELPIPVIGRINRGAFLLDLRGLDDWDSFTAQLYQLAPPP